MKSARLGTFRGNYLIVALCFLVCFPAVGGTSRQYSKGDTERDVQASVRQRIMLIIQRTIARSRFKTSYGLPAVTMPILPSDEDLTEVKSHGRDAVRVLEEYLRSKEALDQNVALRFLGQFNDDFSLATLRGFAEKSKFAGIRQQALFGLRAYPSGKVKPIISGIEQNDPDPEVRATARRLLAADSAAP